MNEKKRKKGKRNQVEKVIYLLYVVINYNDTQRLRLW